MRWNVEVDCIRQAPTWGERNHHFHCFSSLFPPPPFFPWPTETDVTIGFGIAAHFQGWREAGCAEEEEEKKWRGGGGIYVGVSVLCLGVIWAHVAWSSPRFISWVADERKRRDAARRGEMAKRDRWRGAHRAQHLVFEVARRPPPPDGARSWVWARQFPRDGKVSHFSFLPPRDGEPRRRQIRVSI